MSQKQTCPRCGSEAPLLAGGHCIACGLQLGLANREKAKDDLSTKEAGRATEPIAAVPTIKSDLTAERLPAEKPGDRIGRYKLLQKIGEGGCGVVYMAEQEEPVLRRVALKVIKLGMDTRQVIARFEAERQALAMMDHPNIAKVLDAGATETGRPYFVMELVRGIKVTEYCDRNTISSQERLNLFVQICRAVQHAHQKGIIHRDIKPSNILVTMNDGIPMPKIIDFGIAKATLGKLTDQTLFTAFEQFIGTPAYMSPEQAEMSAMDIDTRTDIYSLGVLLYELLTGKTPFDAKELLQAGLDEMRRAIREKEPSRPSTRLSTMEAADLTGIAKRRQTEPPKLLSFVRGDLDWIVMKCLEKDRTRRYETATALAADIQRHLTNEPVTASPPSKCYRFSKFVRRNKLAFAAGTAIAVVLVCATVVSAWQAIRATRAQTLAKERLAEAEAISKFLTGVFQSPDPARSGRTLTVAETLDEAAKKLDTQLSSLPARKAKLQTTLACTYTALGLWREASVLQEKVCGYYSTNFGPAHIETIRAEIKLANYYLRANRIDEAIRLQEHGLPILRKVLGPDDQDTLNEMFCLAQSYNVAGRGNEALKLHEQVAEVERKALGPKNPDTLTATLSLAESYWHAGRRDEGLRMEEQVLTLEREVQGPNHPDTLSALHCVAYSYFYIGREEDGLKMLEEELTIRRKVQGDQHPDTLWALISVAGTYSALGRHDEAIKLGEEAVELYRKSLGAEHFQTIGAIGCLANCYEQAGRPKDALNLREGIFELRRKTLGPEHPDTLSAMGSLARSYRDTGREDEAVKLSEQVLQFHRKVHGSEHPATLGAMNELGRSYAQVGRINEAQKLWEEELPLDRKLFGETNPDTLLTMANLAHCYTDSGRPEEALRLCQLALAGLQEKLGPTNPMTLAVLGSLADSYRAVGRLEEDLKLREQVLEARRKVIGPKHPDTLDAMRDLAASYYEAGRHEEGKALLEKAFEQNPKSAGPLLTLAAWQAWLGQDADYEATRCRAVEAARDTDLAVTADAAAKGYSMRPSSNATLRSKALDLARRAAELGKNGGSSSWGQFVVGLAEYRSGQYADATASLALAEETAGKMSPDGRNKVQGTARLIRAMALFRSGQVEEARKLFSQGTLQMPPLPKDQRKPRIEAGFVDHDILIWWMAYKEAKALIEDSTEPQSAAVR